MSLRNRINQFFNKPKSSPEAPSSPTETSAEQGAVTWDSLAAERRDDDKPQITYDDLARLVPYDDLARLVRFPGSAPAEKAVPSEKSTPAEESTSAETSSADLQAPVFDALETVNGGGSLSDDLKSAEQVPAESVSSDNPDQPSAQGQETAESQESEPISPELQAFKNFFKTDMRVKRELLDAAPKPTDNYDEASRMDYVEGAYRTFRDFKHDFLGIARDFDFGDSVKQATEAFFQRGQQDFALGDYGPGVVQDVYRKAFTDMRPQFIEKVKDSFVGYTVFGGYLDSVIADASTINELLHAYHSCIMNSTRILKGIPALAEKPGKYGDSIVLRGDRSELGQQVFDSFPENFDVGTTDIVSADDHIMMMVRDRGHALTISSEPDTEDPSKIWVNYNIPKLCNEEMIKALPGLAGYTENGARGGFVVSRDQLGASLVNFISKVPTDSDIPPRSYDF